jgi:hypothetical protein
MASGGFVYVITNRAMPGLVKVGRTTRMPEDRARELGGAGVPYPYEVRYALRTSAHRAVEAAAHKLLRSVRLQHEGGGVEWFACSVREARSAIKRAARKLDSVFEPGSLPHHLALAFRESLGRVDILLLVLSAIIVLGPALWPYLHGPLADWLPGVMGAMTKAASASWPALPTDWRVLQPYAAAWLVLRLAAAWCWRHYQATREYSSPAPVRRKARQ